MMFCLSTAHLVLFATSLLRHVHDGIIDAALELPNLKYRESYFQTLVECLNVSPPQVRNGVSTADATCLLVHPWGFDHSLAGMGSLESEEVCPGGPCCAHIRLAG